jgi:5-methylcytosine-specific restriction endonuclease McrA
MSIISTGEYWKIRRDKIPPAFRLLDDGKCGKNGKPSSTPTWKRLKMPKIGQASRWYEGKYSLIYFMNRESVFRRDHYTCAVCGYKSNGKRAKCMI